MIDPFSISETEFRVKKNTVRDYSQIAQEGEAYWFTRNPKGESLKVSVSVKKMNYFLFFLSAFVFVLLGWVFYLQIIKGDHYRNIAENNSIRIKVIKANRGVIYDRNKNLLVRNIPNFYLAIIPADLPRDKEGLNRVMEKTVSILKIINSPVTEEELRGRIKNASFYSYDPLVIEEHIDYEKAVLLKIITGDLPGVFLETRATREYLAGSETAHILGYVGKITKEELEKNKDQEYLFTDYLGKSGLELTYEKILKGIDGKKRVEVDYRGEERKVISRQMPQAGNNLVLSLDLELQKKLSTAMKDGIKRARVTKGAAVVINPQNGEILALASFPEYDDNILSQGITSQNYQKLESDPNEPFLFRAITGEYPSGSIIKPVIAAAALEEKIINRYTAFHSTGGIRIREWFFPDWKAGGHGLTDVIQALSESVNTFFYIIGGGLFDAGGNQEIFHGLGLEKIKEYAELFGLNQLSGIDLPYEKAGFLPTKEWKEETKKERWYVGDTYHLAIGQGDLLVTPLQVADYTAAIANGGTLYRPHLVKEITDTSNNVIESIQPEIIRSNFISKDTLEIVRAGMRQTVVSGSARSLAVLPVKAAGKTGTAQVGGDKNTHAWFTGFAPCENPEIVITVLIENGGEGSSFAVPVAKEILKWYFDKKQNDFSAEESIGN